VPQAWQLSLVRASVSPHTGQSWGGLLSLISQPSP
jgi:hypothetical protein